MPKGASIPKYATHVDIALSVLAQRQYFLAQQVIFDDLHDFRW